MNRHALQNVRRSVSEAFLADSDLIDRWHIEAGKGVRVCIERTMKDVETTFDTSFKFYRIDDGGRLAAYWGTEFGNYINLIWVRPEFRNKFFLNRLWNQVQESVSSPFYAAVYSKNLPAVRFYSRHGSKIRDFHMGADPISVFAFTKDSDLCR